MGIPQLLLFSCLLWLSPRCDASQAASSLEAPLASQPMSMESFPVHDASSLFSDLHYLTGRIDYSRHPDFVRIRNPYSNRGNQYLRADVQAAFLGMRKEALKEGIVLAIVSGARSYWRQKQIWETKWQLSAPMAQDEMARARTVLAYTAMPATSRHHWGTEIDINSTEDRYFQEEKGRREYEWLKRNAARHGFCQVYSAKGESRLTGHEEEKWHWSYMPVSSTLLDNYNLLVAESDINGFPGSEAAPALMLKEHYVNGIDPSCNPLPPQLPPLLDPVATMQ